MSWMMQICGITTAEFNYPLTTWPRSLSMLCQRASLCPAETQEEKHQQTTKRSPWGRSYLWSWIATRDTANASLPPRFMPWTPSQWPSPSLYPDHQQFMTQLLATHLEQNTEAVFISPRFTVWSLKQRALTPPPLLLTFTETERWIERCADEASISPAPLLKRVAGPPGRVEWEKKKRDRKKNYSKSYPFHAFQIALQQRV